MKFGSAGRRRVLTATDGLGFSTTVIDFAGSARRRLSARHGGSKTNRSHSRITRFTWPVGLALARTLWATTLPQTDGLGQARAGSSVVRSDHRVGLRQAPFEAILFRRHAEKHQVPPHRFELLAVLKADDEVGGHRLLDRDRWLERTTSGVEGIRRRSRARCTPASSCGISPALTELCPRYAPTILAARDSEPCRPLAAAPSMSRASRSRAYVVYT